MEIDANRWGWGSVRVPIRALMMMTQQSLIQRFWTRFWTKLTVMMLLLIYLLFIFCVVLIDKQMELQFHTPDSALYILQIQMRIDGTSCHCGGSFRSPFSIKKKTLFNTFFLTVSSHFSFHPRGHNLWLLEVSDWLGISVRISHHRRVKHFFGEGVGLLASSAFVPKVKERNCEMCSQFAVPFPLSSCHLACSFCVGGIAASLLTQFCMHWKYVAKNIGVSDDSTLGKGFRYSTRFKCNYFYLIP